MKFENSLHCCRKLSRKKERKEEREIIQRKTKNEHTRGEQETAVLSVANNLTYPDILPQETSMDQEKYLKDKCYLSEWHYNILKKVKYHSAGHHCPLYHSFCISNWLLFTKFVKDRGNSLYCIYMLRKTIPTKFLRFLLFGEGEGFHYHKFYAP